MVKSLEKYAPWIIRVVGILILVGFLVQGRKSINAPVLVACAVLAVSLLLNARGVESGSAKNSAIAGALSLLLVLQISLSEMYAAPCLATSGVLLKLFLAVGIFANVFLALRTVLTKTLTMVLADGAARKEKATIASRTAGKRNNVVLYKCVIAAESVLFLISTYPGIWLQGDAAGVYGEAVNNVWDAWHTIGYVWFVRLCTLVYNSPYAVNVAQTVFWVILNFYILDILEKTNKGNAFLYTVLLCCSTFPFLYLEMLAKDTVFSMGILATTAVLYKVLETEAVSGKDVLCLATIPVFSLLCRHGGELVVLVSCAATLAYFLVKHQKQQAKKILVALLWLLFVYLLVNVVLTKALSVAKNPSYVKYSTPMAMVGAAVAQDVTFSEEDTAILERVMPLEQWGECYNRYWSDDIARDWGKIGPDAVGRLQEEVDNNGFGAELLRINAKLLIQHPVIYLRAFFDMNSILWEFGTPQEASLMSVAMVKEDEQIRYSAAYTVTRTLAQFLDSYPLTRAVMVRGGVPLFLILFCAVILGIRKKALLISFLPIALVELMLAFTVPAQDPRYILPAIECAVLFVSIVLAKAANGKKRCMAHG